MNNTTEIQGVYFVSEEKHASRWQAMRDLGLPVACSWIDRDLTQPINYSQDWDTRLIEASGCDVVVVFVESGEHLKDGRETIGAALAAGVSVIAVLPEDFSDTWVNHQRVQRLDTLAEALKKAQQLYDYMHRDQANSWRDMRMLSAAPIMPHQGRRNAA